MKSRSPFKKKSTKAQDRLRSEGAEFLVLANLLIRDIQATKAYTNFPAWDVLAVNPESGKQARIQGKSRWATDSSNFLVKNFECDFVVLVYLNRGYNFSKRGKAESGLKDPEFWIFPIDTLKAAIEEGQTTGKLGDSISFNKKHLPNEAEDFKGRWESIAEFLSE